MIASPIFIQSGVWRRETTTSEQRTLTRIGRPYTLRNALAIPGHNELPVLVGTFTVSGSVIGGPDDISYTVILVAEDFGNGYQRAGLAGTTAWIGEDAVVSTDVIDVLDVTGNGFPEIIFRQTGWERRGFGVLRREVDGWEAVIEWAAVDGC